MSDIERILQWNKHLPSPKPSCVHELIGRHGQEQPEAPAICAWDRDLTYEELDDLATAVAHHLVSLGAGPERFVPLFFEKSVWAVVSMLAVLKAGAACVFLEPTHPMERLLSMLNDMQAEFVLCSPTTVFRMTTANVEALQLVQVTESSVKSWASPSNRKLPRVQPTDAAIGLFTSGSTGKPKGIVQEHSTAAFSAQTCASVFEIGPGSRVLQWAAYCFDMSVIDILMTLVGGGCICIPSEQDRTDNLLATMRDMGINFAAMTPSFAQTIKIEGVPSLKTMVFGGEPVAKDHLAGWPSNLRIINGYGPAESSVCVAGLASQVCPANVGRAVGAVTWIVEESDYNRLAPIGAIGELLLEGPLLARGYLNDTEKTAASFIEDLPWLTQVRGRSKTPRRVYRTGDLARYDTDGTIILMGRKDTQVKLRGQRIETADIEHHINTRLAGQFSVAVDVITPIGGPGNQKLVAFLGLNHSAGLHVGYDDRALLAFGDEEKIKLRSCLQGVEADLSKSLPAYMIPSYYIPLRQTTLTTSGKTDRKRLRCIGSSLTIAQILELTTVKSFNEEQQNEVEPRIRESDLAVLWAKILQMEAGSIGPYDDFFKLGGDSITAMQLVVSAGASQIRLTTTQVFQNPSLAAMSLVSTRIVAHAKSVNAIAPVLSSTSTAQQALLKEIFCPGHNLIASEVKEIVEASDMQAYMVVCGLLKTHGYINYFAFDLKGIIHPERLKLACNALANRHSALRTIFGIRSARVLQLVLKSCEPEFIQLPSESTTEALLASLCEADKITGARLGDKIVRFILVERTSKDHTLILRISHAQFDGTSLALIYRDLQLAYRGDVLPSSPQYTDFSRAAMTANTRESEEFWRNVLRGSAMTNIIQPWRPPFCNIINDRVSLEFPLAVFHQPGITVATLVKGAWATVLAEMSSTKDVVFGYAVTGRNLPLEGINLIVGDCNNAALARVRLDVVSTVLDLLEQIQAQYLAAIPYESIGSRQMVEKCSDWPRYTRYSTSVNHQNYTDAGLENFRMGNADCKVSYKDLEADRRDIQIYSWPPRDGHMKIGMAFCNHAIPRELVQNMLEALSTKIQSFAVNFDAPLVLSSQPCCKTPFKPSNSKVSSDALVLPEPRSFRFSHLDPESVVTRIWEQFVTCIDQELLVPSGINEDTPFYDLGGDLVYTAQLSAFYAEEGVDFAMETLIEHPTKRGQLNLLRSFCPLEML